MDESNSTYCKEGRQNADVVGETGRAISKFIEEGHIEKACDVLRSAFSRSQLELPGSELAEVVRMSVPKLLSHGHFDVVEALTADLLDTVRSSQDTVLYLEIVQSQVESYCFRGEIVAAKRLLVRVRNEIEKLPSFDDDRDQNVVNALRILRTIGMSIE